MGSVSSLINGTSVANKHCRASEHRVGRAAGHRRRSGGCSLDGLLRCGFAQASSAAARPSGRLAHSGRSEDFFYIKTSAEKSLVRSTAFKPVIPRRMSSTETGHNSLEHILCPREKAKTPDIKYKHDTFSGTLSDSGRNSMSSLPTHSTSGSLSTSTGPVSHGDGSSAPANGLSKGALPNLPPWVSGNSSNLDCSSRPALAAGAVAANANGDAGSPRAADGPSPLSETAGGVRSPITTDESLIERLEQRLLERETELQELQVSFEEKEADTCQLFETRQRYCAEEMEGLKQRCSTKLRQVSQMAAKTQQALQLQVGQLQAERERLQADVLKLTREKDVVELRLRSYETNCTQLAPTLEETQWEVCQKTGEISLLKQQLRDCQADVSHKLSEIVALRTSLKENAAKVETLEKRHKEHEDELRSRTIEAEVCQNELQRKKNEADLLREKVGKLEKDVEAMKQDLAAAKEHRPQRSGHPEAHAHVGREGEGEGEGEGEERAPTASLQREVERLQQQLREEKEAGARLAHSFQQERTTWNREKDRVIKYQKQLQVSYLHMHKKNQDLERILKELTAELENRTELGLDAPFSAGLQTYDDVIATEI
ncbi:leucine zipper putative tumor suppressor 1 isoform X2 [Betta splendens]|uniref:Leucine zipper putative tumor suppressor 1 isoform X2 n=1 Tax=Betta splendens TaxID=158456 RepID=A0A6P7NM88_BETSP|nr:leucine zipper putative tumor suppressor 1 isoform X2 [Betta splendens]